MAFRAGLSAATAAFGLGLPLAAAAAMSMAVMPAAAQTAPTYNATVGAQQSSGASVVPQAGAPRLRPLPQPGQGIAGYANPTLRQMIGQMIMVGFKGSSASSSGVREVAQMIRAGDVGGVIYLGHNVSSLHEAARMNASFVNANPGLPPLIAIDQEGGQIERLTERHGFREIPSAASIAKGSVDRAARTYAGVAAGLKRHGFNLNLGPVVDVNINPRNPIIARYGRSYSSNPDTVARFASAFVRAHRDNGVLTALKHFPGHGSSTADSHLGFTNITRTWRDIELEPYRRMIAEGSVDMVMTGHLYHSRLNAGGPARTPATLSAATLGLLRQMSPDVVIITDDMQMGAIRKEFSFADALIQAVMAGNDVLMYTALGQNWTGLPARVIATLEAQAQPGTQLRARIEQSYRRIVALKQQRLNADPSAIPVSMMDRPIDFPQWVALPPRKGLQPQMAHIQAPHIQVPQLQAQVQPGITPQVTGTIAAQPILPQPVVQQTPGTIQTGATQAGGIGALIESSPAPAQLQFAPSAMRVDPAPELGIELNARPQPGRSLLSYQGVKAAMQRLLMGPPGVQPPAVQ
jgi:beta-N-acetylhexosaminidase